MRRTIAIIGLIVLLVAIAVTAPWLLFWSIKTLFGLAIPYTWPTWCAAWVLMALFAGGASAT